MKKLSLVLFSVMAIAFATTSLHAQTSTPDFYAGKWDVLAKGLPQGDTHLFFIITEKDGKLSGILQDTATKTDIPLTKVEKDSKGGLVINFTAQGYDVTMNMEKKDEDHIAGNMMGMFDCTGVRIKE